MRHYLALGLIAALLAACGPDPTVVPIDEATTPQYAPDDPCKGVVPELCAY